MYTCTKMHSSFANGCFMKLRNTFRECKRHVKTFKDIPGPKQLPMIGNLHLFGPLGPYKFEYWKDATTDLNKKYGPIVCVKLGMEMVFLFEPSAIEIVFRSEGKYPQRPLFDTLVKHRSENPDKYRHLGLFTDNGHDWSYIRNLVNPMLRSGAVDPYMFRQCLVADDFMTYLHNLRDSKGQVKDMLRHLYKYTQEAIGIISFGKRLGCFSQNSSFSNQINNYVENTLNAMSKSLLQAPLWKLFPTPTYKALVKSQLGLMKVAEDHVNEFEERLRQDPSLSKEQPFLSSLLSKTDLDRRDLNLIMMELFQAGIDNTAATIAMTLHYLGRNLILQEELISELDQVAPSGTPITRELISKLKYMRMCIKETLRLFPPAGGSARLLSSDLVLSGYEVPKGTLVVGMHPTMSCNATFVKDPQRYYPMRWSREEGKRPTVPPFVSLPFGFGVRSCPGRQIAEQEVTIFLIKFFQRFRCNFYGGNVKAVMRLNYLPEKPLDFTLVERLKVHDASRQRVTN